MAPERLAQSGPGWHRSTRRNAGTTMVPVAVRPAARGTWHVPPRKGLPKNFEQRYRSHEGAPQIRNSQVTRLLHQLKIHWGCRFSGVPAARARGEEAVLTWGPPVKVNFELATPNSVHGCTLARPTWRRMKKGAGVHCARAVHVQLFFYIRKFARTYRSNGRNHPSQTRRSNAYCANLKSIGGATSVGCMLH